MRSVEFVSSFLKMDEDAIFNLFKTIKGAELNSIYPRWLYIPGTRKDKVLLVAHADTVWARPPERLTYKNGVIYNADLKNVVVDDVFTVEGLGIGADDRAGIALLWAFKNSGHSILITEGEEIGIGSYTTAYDPFIQDVVPEHSYAVEFDRGGNNQVVFYNNERKEFKKFIQDELAYVEVAGSFSDIKIICEGRIPSTNVSIGYNHAHQPVEMLVVRAWETTYHRVSNLLKKEQKKWEL